MVRLNCIVAAETRVGVCTLCSLLLPLGMRLLTRRPPPPACRTWEVEVQQAWPVLISGVCTGGGQQAHATSGNAWAPINSWPCHRRRLPLPASCEPTLHRLPRGGCIALCRVGRT